LANFRISKPWLLAFLERNHFDEMPAGRIDAGRIVRDALALETIENVYS